MLELRQVNTYYGKIQALQDVSIRVDDGEIVTLIGANGAGKSTTLMTVCGILHPRSGEIVWNGAPIHQLPPHDIVKLGISQVMVNRFNLGGMGLKNKSSLTLDRDTLKKAFADVESFAAANPGILFVSGVCTPLCVMDPAPYPHIRFTWCSTDFSRRPVAVSYTGDVRFCNHSPHIIGNIHQRSISDILTDPVNIGRYATVPDHCRDCSLFPRCNGGCRAASEQAYGSFNLPDPVVEVSLLRSEATKAASAASPSPEGQGKVNGQI